MKITFLGTSHGVPAADRFCSAYMIESGDFFYFVDAGAPLVSSALAHGLDMKDLKGVFTTHAHGDHTSGILNLADLINWYYKETSADIYMTDERCSKAFQELICLSNNMSIDKERVRFLTAHEGIVFDDGRIKAEYIPNKHISYSPSYSVLVTEGEKRVLFSGDLSVHLKEKDIPRIVFDEGVDVFVCELAHFSLGELRPYLDIAKVGKLVFTHVYPIEKYEEIEGIKGSYPYEILTPDDGFEMKI